MMQSSQTFGAGWLLSIVNRFQKFDTDTVLNAAHILEVDQWPKDDEQLAVCGEVEINVLAQHFHQLLERNDFHKDEALAEWLDLKVQVKNNQTPQKTCCVATYVYRFSRKICQHFNVDRDSACPSCVYRLL